MKKCIGCDETKPLSEFGSHATSSDRRQYRCRVCIREKSRKDYYRHHEERKTRQRDYYQRNRERIGAKARERYKLDPQVYKNATKEGYWRRKYGLTPDDYYALLDAQNHRCKICGVDEPNGRGWCVDHCHSTGKVRGILCSRCNNGLGHFQDSPETLAAARAYVLEHAPT